MGNFEAAIAWSATVAYAVASLSFVFALVFHKMRAQKVAMGTGLVGVLLHVGVVIIRTVNTGHLPVEGVYENALTAALCISVPYLPDPSICKSCVQWSARVVPQSNLLATKKTVR
jgi:ABC-type transport system involved in cytochrome c biogenesis permease subunit